MRRIALLFLVLSVLGCSQESATDQYILADAIKNANHGNIEVINIDLQEGKLVKGGKLVTADAIVPASIRPEELRPTALGIIKGIGQKYPGCEWISIRMFDDRLMAQVSHFFAMAELKEGKINITGGLPTDAEMNEFNKAKLDPDSLDFSGKTRPYTLRHPTEEDKKIANQWALTSLELHKSRPSAIQDADIDAAVAKTMKLSVSRVSNSNKAVYHYYHYKTGDQIN